MSYNRVILMGNLGKDPEIRSTNSGHKVANLSLATNESYKNEEGNWINEVTWHTLVLWNKAAEYAEAKLNKGAELIVEGKIKNESYNDKDGVKHYTSKIAVSSFQVVHKKDSKPEAEQHEEAAVHNMAPEAPEGEDLPY